MTIRKVTTPADSGGKARRALLLALEENSAMSDVCVDGDAVPAERAFNLGPGREVDVEEGEKSLHLQSFLSDTTTVAESGHRDDFAADGTRSFDHTLDCLATVDDVFDQQDACSANELVEAALDDETVTIFVGVGEADGPLVLQAEVGQVAADRDSSDGRRDDDVETDTLELLVELSNEDVLSSRVGVDHVLVNVFAAVSTRGVDVVTAQYSFAAGQDVEHVELGSCNLRRRLGNEVADEIAHLLVELMGGLMGRRGAVLRIGVGEEDVARGVDQDA